MNRSLACIAAAFMLSAGLASALAPARADADEFLPLESSHAVIDSASPQCADSAHAARTAPAGRPFFNRQLKWATIAILASIAAGFLVRFKRTRRLRIVFLLASLAVLGFLNGACPCPIQSFMNFVRLAIGKTVSWKSLAYFAGLIPVTYVFGKTWCGWVCHMGALQEFLHLPARFTLPRSARAIRAMRAIRLILFAALIAWVAVTKVAAWCRYDPFRVAYTLSSATTVGWVLLGLLVLLSLFIYRPFCRAFCPIGLALGWVARIPGASVLGLGRECPVCLSCGKACRIDAIIQDGDSYSLDNTECVACGDCMDACRLGGLSFFRKNKKHPSKFRCVRPSSCKPS